MGTNLQNYKNSEETEVQAKDNKYVETRYTGLRKSIQGKGRAYFIANENQWYFQPKDSEEWYRVNETSLDFER